MSSHARVFLQAVALCCMGVNAPAHGQEEPPDSVVKLEPIVVRVLPSAVGTGTPFPISVAGRDELQRGVAGVFLEDAVRALPGVQIQNRFNLASGERLVVRGFGSRAQFGIRSLRILVDGIPATLPDGQTAIDHLDLSSLARVELLRGPGAALYGNAAGGVIHFQSLPPSDEEPGGELRVAGGSHGLRSYTGSLTGSVRGTAFRMGVSRFSYDGFRLNPLEGGTRFYGGAERTILNGVLSRPFAAGELRMVFNGLDLDARNAGSLSKSLLANGNREAYRFNVIQRTREGIQQGQAGLTWSGPVGSLNAEVSAWGVYRAFEGRIPPRVVEFDRRAGGVRALFRSTPGPAAGTLSFGGGFEVELQNDDRSNWGNEEGSRGELSLDQEETVRSIGIFAQGRLELGRGIAAVAGMRVDHFRFEARDDFLQDATDDSGTRTMDALSPSLGVVWDPQPWVELFGSLATSFETPTTTELSNRPSGAGGLNPDLDPIRGITLDGGVRFKVAEDWSLEGTAFRTDLQNELVAFEVPDVAGRAFFRNAGKSDHRGIEVTLEGRPSAWSWMRVAYTRVDARFESYTVEGEDLSGNRIPGLAPHRIDGRFLARYRGGFAELRGLYQEAIPVDDRNLSEAPPFFVVDLRTGLTRVRAGGASLSPFFSVANLLDRRYVSSVVVNAFGGRYFEPGPGRSYQLGVSMAFRN